MMIVNTGSIFVHAHYVATQSQTQSKHHCSHIPNDELANEFRAVLNSIGDGVIVVAKDLTVAICNPAAEEMLGFSADDVKGKLLAEVLKIQTESGQQAVIDVAHVFDTLQRHSICQHVFLKRGNGDVLPVTYCVSPVRGHEQEARGVVLTLRDARQEHEMNKMKTEFASVVSHQLRTPLASVKWFLETVLDAQRSEALTKNQQENLEQAFQSNERMIALVNDLLNMSRLENGTVHTTPAAVNIVELCASVISDTELFAHANNVRIDCRLADMNIPPVYADQAAVRQVIQNILSNAIKYTKNHEVVTITAQVQPTELILSFADQGIGVPEIDQRRIFEPFFRAENAIATRAEGSGLGLYICKMLLERNKGRIWMNSIEGKGSTVSIALPVHTGTHT